jgi:DNA-binding NarL/FixJ family response regulator
MKPKKARVLLVEDHTLVRAGIRSLLEASPEIMVVGEAGSGRQAVAMCDELQPDLVLMDVAMEELNGVEAARQIHDQHPDIKVLMVSVYRDRQYVCEAIKAGASGYVLKDAAVSELLLAIRTVLTGRRYLSPPLADLVMDDFIRTTQGEQITTELDKLTSREREILQLLAEGRSSAQVGSTLHLSARTVDTHRYRIMQKLDIHSIVGLTKFAIRHGLCSLS